MKLSKSLAGAALTAVTAAMLAVPTPVASAATGGCVGGDANRAATRLYGPGTSVAEQQTVAGLKTVLAMEPLIHPGTRHRMISAAGKWCDATADFNTAWRLAGKNLSDSRAVAQAYARLAAAPYFDAVSVKSATGAVGAWTVRTHALTNGVDATWTIVTDAEGVRTAKWVATGFAVKPLVAQWEGLTALPDATETYTRLAGGLLRETRGLPTAAGAAAAALGGMDDGPGLSSRTFADGFTITVAVGDSHVGVTPGVGTGVQQADIVQDTLSAARTNYPDFLSWGLKKNWETLQPLDPDTGYIGINDALSAYCLACVFNSSDFNIHLLSEARTALVALGYDGYADPKKAWDLIVGHEMFHNFQNGYSNPGTPGDNLTAGRFTHTAYAEGTARFQESLHDYAEVGFAPGTLATANDANGCNGFDEGGPMDAAMARGPFTITYNACFFWGPWFAKNGKAALLKLVTKTMPANATKDGFGEIGPAVTAAAGRPLAVQLAEFAAASITGHGRAWRTWSGKERFDWDKQFDRWKPTTIKRGTDAVGLLGGGGIIARKVTKPMRVSAVGDKGVRLYVVQDLGKRFRVTKTKNNSAVVRPRRTPTYAVAVRPVDGIHEVSLLARRPGSAAPAPPAVPSGPAQKPVTGTVATGAPGAGERVDGATSTFLEFSVPANVDNATTNVAATPAAPGDIDLYLQARVGGSWVDVAEGESSDVLGEAISTGRLAAGKYRLEVHNYACAPGTPVDVVIKFKNSKGQTGK